MPAAAAVLVPAAEQDALPGLDGAEAAALGVKAPQPRAVHKDRGKERMRDKDAVALFFPQPVEQRLGPLDGRLPALRPARGAKKPQPERPAYNRGRRR